VLVLAVASWNPGDANSLTEKNIFWRAGTDYSRFALTPSGSPTLSLFSELMNTSLVALATLFPRHTLSGSVTFLTHVCEARPSLNRTTVMRRGRRGKASGMWISPVTVKIVGVDLRKLVRNDGGP
jgi:hypothetical protein